MKVNWIKKKKKKMNKFKIILKTKMIKKIIKKTYQEI